MLKSSSPRSGILAFTLLEISVVLLLISVVLGGGLVILTAAVQQSANDQTIATMQAIDTALYNFRLANNRLPCPGDLTQIPGSATYGLEAGTTTPGISSSTNPSSGLGNGTCGSSLIFVTPSGYESVTPSANFGEGALWSVPGAINNIENGTTLEGVSEGAVPVRALRLPDSYMYDGWGNQISYAVDMNATANNAFTTLPNMSLNACGPITVEDATGAARTSAAIYALISHGADSYGAYTQNGVVSAATSSNTNEQTNCHYSGGACYGGAYLPTFVQQLPGYQSGNAGNALYYFDDIVTFKERWQLQSPQDSNPPPAPYNGLGLVVGGPVNGSPVSGNVGPIYPYQQNGSTFTFLSSDPATQPTFSTVNSIAFSPDNTLMAIGGTDTSGHNEGLVVYSVAGGLIAAVTPAYAPILGATVSSVAFSKDERLFAVMYNVASYLALLPFFSISSSPGTLPTAAGPVAFSPDGKYFAVVSGTATPTVLIYSVSCSTLTYVSTLSTSNALPAGITAINAVSFSNDDTYMALAATVSGVGEALVYQNNGAGTFTAASGSPITPPGSNTSATGVAFSHSGNTLAVVTQGASPYIYFYTNNRNGTFTAFSPVTVGAGTHAAALAWSRDDQYVAVADGASDTGGAGYAWDGLALYQVIGTTVNPLSPVATPPGVSTNAVAFIN